MNTKLLILSMYDMYFYFLCSLPSCLHEPPYKAFYLKEATISNFFKTKSVCKMTGSWLGWTKKRSPIYDRAF